MNEDLLNTFGINEASNFVSTGTTGDKDIDQTVAATDFVQRSVASGATFPEIMESARKLSEPIQAKIAENLVTASEDRPLTGSQMIASAVLQIAPILIGAAYSGKVGAGIGATAGVGGLGSYNKAIETRNERTRKSALAENKVLQGQLNNLNKQAMSAQEGMIKDAQRREDREYKRDTSLMVAGKRNQGQVAAAGAELFMGERKQVLDSINMANEAASLSSELESLPKEGFLTDKAKWIANSQLEGSREWLLKNKLKSLTNRLVEVGNTGAPSNSDVERLIQEMQGTQYYPANPENLAKLVRVAEGHLRKHAVNTMKGVQELSKPGGLEDMITKQQELITNAPQLFKGNTPPPATSRTFNITLKNGRNIPNAQLNPDGKTYTDLDTGEIIK
jgi:hypothetical protein